MSARGRDGRDGAIRRGFVVRRVSDGVHGRGTVLDEGEQRVEQRRRLGRQIGLGEDRRPHRRIGEALAEFGRSEFSLELAERRAVGEGVIPLKAEQHAERPGGELRVHANPVIECRTGDIELLAPEVGRRLGLHHRKRHRPVDLSREADHPVEFAHRPVDVLPRRAVRCHLEHRLAAGGHRAAQREQLILGGIGARDGFAVDGPMGFGAGCREAQCTSLDRLLDDARHAGDILGVGGLVARPSFPHHVTADRAVGHLGAVIHCQSLLFDCVEVFGEALPLPGDALGQCRTGDILDAFHQFDQPLFAAGGHRCEPDTAVAADHRGHPVQARRLQQSVPADLTVVVGVDVDEPGCDDASGCVDVLRRLSVQTAVVALAAPDLDNDPVLDPDIGPERRATGAVDNGSSGDRQVVHAASSAVPPPPR